MPLTVWVHTLFPPHVFNPLSPSSFVRPSLQPRCLNKKKKKKKLQREWSSSFLQTHSSWIVFKSLSDCTGTFEHIQKGGVFVLQPEFLHANCFFPHKVSWAGNLFTTSSWWHFKAKANLYSCLQQRLNLQKQSLYHTNAKKTLFKAISGTTNIYWR